MAGGLTFKHFNSLKQGTTMSRNDRVPEASHIHTMPHSLCCSLLPSAVALFISPRDTAPLVFPPSAALLPITRSTIAVCSLLTRRIAVRCGAACFVRCSQVQSFSHLSHSACFDCRGAPTRMALIPLWLVTSVESWIHHHNCLAVKRAKKCKMKKLKAVRSKPRLEAVCTKDGRHFQQCFQLTLLVSGSEQAQKIMRVFALARV